MNEKSLLTALKEFYESKINSLEWTDEERRLSRNLDFIIVMLEEME